MVGTIEDRVEVDVVVDNAVAEPAFGKVTTDGDTERTARLLGVLASANLLDLIRQLGDRELDVGQLVELLGVSQPNVSQHLGRLRSAGVVVSDRRGQHVTNRLSTPMINAICELAFRLADELGRSRTHRLQNPAEETDKR